jgi:hypothetical protein
VYTINKDARRHTTREEERERERERERGAQPTTAGAAGASSVGLVGEGCCCCWFSEPACCSLLRRFFLRSSLDSLVLPSAPSSLLFRCARESQPLHCVHACVVWCHLVLVSVLPLFVSSFAALGAGLGARSWCG